MEMKSPTTTHTYVSPKLLKGRWAWSATVDGHCALKTALLTETSHPFLLSKELIPGTLTRS